MAARNWSALRDRTIHLRGQMGSRQPLCASAGDAAPDQDRKEE